MSNSTAVLSPEEFKELAAAVNQDSVVAINHRLMILVLSLDGDTLKEGFAGQQDTVQTMIDGISKYTDYLYSMANLADFAMMRLEELTN